MLICYQLGFSCGVNSEILFSLSGSSLSCLGAGAFTAEPCPWIASLIFIIASICTSGIAGYNTAGLKRKKQNKENVESNLSQTD